MAAPSRNIYEYEGEYRARLARDVREFEMRDELMARRRLVDTYENQIQELQNRFQSVSLETANRAARKDKQMKKVAREAVALSQFKLVNASKINNVTTEFTEKLQKGLNHDDAFASGTFGSVFASDAPEFCFKLFRHEIGGFIHPPVSPLILQPLAYVRVGRQAGIVYQRYSGSLAAYLQKEKLSEEAKRILIGQLDDLMIELWTLHWAHGDIKPANILVDKDRKLILGDSDDMCQTSLINPSSTFTRKYHPVYFSVDPGERKEVDLWSFGIMLFELLQGGEPITSGTTLAEIQKALGERSSLVSKIPERRADYVKQLIDGLSTSSSSR